MKFSRILALTLLLLMLGAGAASAAGATRAAGATDVAPAGQAQARQPARPAAANGVGAPAAPAAYTVRPINVYQACNVDLYNEGPHNGTTNTTRWDYDRVDSNPSPNNDPDSAHPVPLDYYWLGVTPGVTTVGWLRENDGSGVWAPDGPAFNCTDPLGCAPITVKLWVNNDAGDPGITNYNCPEICSFIDRDSGACNDPRGEWLDPGGAITPGTICEFRQTWNWDIATSTWSPTSTQDLGIVLPCTGAPPPSCTTSQVFGYVYNDADNDGVRDTGETGIGGAVVRVTSAETGYDQSVTIPVGSSNGYWIMSALPVPADGQATYVITVTYPNATPKWAPTTPTSISIANNCSGSKQVAHGATQAARLGDFVWLDTDGDGVQDAGEPGVPGVSVTLVDVNGVQLNDANGVPYARTTDGAGAYLFDDLRPGTYYVKFTPPAGYVLTTANAGGNDNLDSDPSTSTLRTGAYTLAAGGSNLTVDAGLRVQATYDFGDLPASYGTLTAAGGPRHTITANLYLGAAVDNEADGQPTAGATGDDANGATPDDEDGITLLTGILPGQPACVAVTAHNATGAAAALQGWFDFNADGDFADAGEAVALSNASIPNGGVTGQPACFTVPANASVTGSVAYRFRLSQAGGLGSGGNAPDGEVEDYVGPLVCLGDRVWTDADRDGVQDAGENDLAGVTVRLLDDTLATIATDVTDANGLYGFCGLLPGQPVTVEVFPPAGYVFSAADQGGDDATDSDVTPVNATPGAAARTAVITPGAADDLTWDAGLYPTYCLGDRIWLDADLDGLQDAGENGVNSLTVRLLDAGGAELALTTTAGDGAYQFCGLYAGQQVRVRFSPTTGYLLAPADQGADNAVDSDFTASGASAETPLITMPAANDFTWDGGMATPLGPFAMLGDTVWHDLNGNGVQDAGEPGVPGVTVTLSDGAGTPLATTTTDGAGYYEHQVPAAGNYYVTFTPPAGFAFTPADQGGNDGLDSDADPASGRTPATFVQSGDFIETLDAGLYQPASLGDTVWYDLDGDGVQDVCASSTPCEPPAAGVTVTLYDAGGNPIGTSVTDAGGAYAFSNLPPGSYSIGVTPPAGASFAPANQGGDAATDSDIDPATGRSGPIPLTSGANDPTWDAGLLPALDWGDLPAGYPTTAVADGPRHRSVPGFMLGSQLDAETDGQPSPVAAGDGFDEDGVDRLPAPNSGVGGWTDGLAANGDGCRLAITVSGQAGYVQAWLDFGSGLQAIVLRDAAGAPVSFPVAPGAYQFTCDVPAGTFGGGNREVYGRFRLSTAGGLSATGPAADGEVEDYLFGFGPTAVSFGGFTATSAGPGDALWAVLYGILGTLAVSGGVRFVRNQRPVSERRQEAPRD